MWEMIWEVILDALLDSAKMLPFLFLAYLLIEYIERRHSEKIEKALAGGGEYGFFPGAVLGCVPQCGFSAMAANLYGSKVITLGTLMAVFIATSDEAIPVMLASPEHWKSLALIIGLKVLVALLAGFLLDFVLCRFLPHSVRGGYTGTTREVDCHDHHEQDTLLMSAAKHTLNIFVFILLFNLAIGALIALVGEENIAAFVQGWGVLEPAMAGVIGLIPNCAASVLLTQLYMSGALSFGGVVAGLCTGAGVGLAVLFKANRSVKQNAFIVAALYVIGVAAGMIVSLFT